MLKLQQLLDASTNALFAVNKQGQIVVSNKKAIKLLGRVQNISSIKNEELKQDIQKNKNGAIVHKGREYNVLTEVFNHVVFVCLEDISEKNKLYEENDSLLTQLNYTEQSSKIGYWEYDIITKKAVWSDEMYNLLGCKDKSAKANNETIGKRVIEEDKKLYDKMLKSLIAKKQSIEIVLRIMGEKGQIHHCLVKGSTIVGDNGFRAIGTMQDLTDLYEKNIALNKAKQRAEEMNLAKSYFLARASHDLRQPMQALKVFVYNLKEENLNKKQTEIANKIEDSANNLDGLLNNLLDISKIESGGFRVEAQKFDLKNLLDNIIEEFEDVAEHNHIHIEKGVDCKTTINTDPVLLERIIRNIFSNAVKYTKNKIIISCRRSSKMIEIVVEDNGYGISNADLAHIFDEFYQSEKIEHNKRLGAGLGLSIVKKLIDILNGEIKVDSVLGKGSRFIIGLPV